jgi:mRNA interferase HigB
MEKMCVGDFLEKAREFSEEHEDAEVSLRKWFQVVEKAEWTSFNDVRETFASADRFGDCYIFNIHGNDYRLIAKISKKWIKVGIRHILTHGEYDRGKWKKGCS